MDHVAVLARWRRMARTVACIFGFGELPARGAEDKWRKPWWAWDACSSRPVPRRASDPFAR